MPHRSHAVKITAIEVIPLRLPYEDRIRKAFYHFGMNEEVTVYKFHTDTGLVGLGENPAHPLSKTCSTPTSAPTLSTTSWAPDASTSTWPVTT